jgi:hypothetical protein
MTTSTATRIEEQFRQGMAMLADPAAAAGWRAALELVDLSAAAGMPDAIERRALFECMGVGRPRDWNKALDSLAEAAAAGSQGAARQLVLLAEDRFDAEPPPRNCAELRARISLDGRLQAPRGLDLSSDPLIKTIAGFATAAECKWLIAAAAPHLERAIIYSTETGEPGRDAGRTNRFALFDFAHLDLVIEMIRARIASAIGAPLPCLEVSQVLSYAAGEEFAPHCDFLDARSMADEIARRGQRAVTVLVYLNEEFEGGETSFPELGLDHRGRTGDALVFSNVDPGGMPDPRTRHAGRPPTHGEKWLFSQWVRDRMPA